MDARAHARHPAPMTDARTEESDFQAARLTVRLPAIVANYRTYRRMAGPTAVAAVVKADGYGLGAGAIAPALAAAGCDSFFAARLEEAVALRKPAAQGAHARNVRAARIDQRAVHPIRPAHGGPVHAAVVTAVAMID